MTTQLDELIDLARLQAGQPLEIRREPTDLVALASELAAEPGERDVRHRIQVESLVAELVGQWDGARLSRVLDNLISNAVKYSPNGDEVYVRLSRDEGYAVLQVEDHGLGIPADDLPRIFDRFHRAANVTGRIDGIGLGLAGARQIVNAHGSIAIQSQEGVGTTVTDHDVMGGKPVIKGTHIPVDLVLTKLSVHHSIGDLLSDYPDLTIDQIKDCLRYASTLAQMKKRRRNIIPW